MTKINDELTILLTIKGRHLHTLRWLWHANRIGLPFHVYIADGQPNKTLVDLLSQKDTFPNLSYQHELYEDNDFSCYYKKIEDGLSRVNTEFVMLSDNDDFVLPSSIEKSITFLKHNLNHVGASGRMGWFHLSNTQKDSPRQLVGTPAYLFPNTGGYAPRNIDHNSPRSRVISGLTPFTVTYYSAFRTKQLSIAARECSQINFYSLNNVEMFFHLRMLCFGSIHIDGRLASYIRQKGTSSGTGNYDIFEKVLDGSHSYDIRRLIQLISKRACEKDKEEQRMANELFAMFKDRIIERIRVEFPFVPRLLRRFPVLRNRYLYWAVSNTITILDRAFNRETYQQRRVDGLLRASEEDLDAVKSTLADRDLGVFLSSYRELDQV